MPGSRGENSNLTSRRSPPVLNACLVLLRAGAPLPVFPLGRRRTRNAAEQKRTCIRSPVDGQCGKRVDPPLQVRDFQAIIGRETKVQCAEAWNGLPDILLACVGGGSNAIGLFHHFVVRRCCSKQLCDAGFRV